MGEELGEEEGKKNGAGCFPKREHAPWVFYLETFIYLCRWKSQGSSQGRVSAKYSSVFQVCPFKVVVSIDCPVSDRAGQSLLITVGLVLPTRFCCFSGPGAEIQLRPRCYVQGGDHLYLAVHYSDILFSYLSQFPYSSRQGIFLASYYPVLISHRHNKKKYKL